MTPMRAALVIALVVGVLVAVATESRLLQLAAVAIATAALVMLLTRLDRSSARDSGLPARPGSTGRRTIGTVNPIVSVMIPGRNEAAYARDCIRSLKDQTLVNFEAIVIDDGSTDSTLDVVLDEIGDDPRFRVFRTSRSVGIARARNEAVNRTTARYVTFLDLDDFVTPEALADRVEVAEAHADRPWIAGSYCGFETVDPDATPERWHPTKPPPTDTISWLSPIDDVPVIVSAPLLRRDVFLTLGGFEALHTGEDSAFWFKMLRWGFVLVSTATIGAAYRRKPTSHAVATTVDLRNLVARLLSDRTKPEARPAKQLGPYFFEDGVEPYRASLGFARRTASALGQAVATDSPSDVIDGLIDDLRSVPYPLYGWIGSVRRRAVFGVTRVTRGRGDRPREEIYEREIDRLLAPLNEDALREASGWMATSEHAPLTGVVGDFRPVRRPTLLPVSSRSIQALTRAGRPFLLLPSSAYHTDELIVLAEELRSRGFAPIAMLNEKRWATTGVALARVDVPAVTALPAGDWLLDFDALLTFNDWGEYYQEYVNYVAGKRTVSFAKVEGVQDWLDHDTGRVRNAYLAADVVLCQGDNDVAALAGRRERLEVVGSDRLEAIWNNPLPADREPRVVGNVNFTYGVQTEHRALWVSTLRDACQEAGVPLDLSMHPSETAKYPGLAASEPIRHLLVTDSILVSRFSTVLFEGMARGCSVIYYNPHGEQVPTFHHPDGAFDLAADPATLAGHIATATKRTRAEAKERAAAFFQRQVSMIPGTSVAVRMADAIERNLPRS